jgi:predicted PurR-regulated permease PerM
MKKIIILLFFASLVLQGFAQTREVPFTLDDRDRIMRTEEQIKATNEKIESLRNEMNSKFEGMDSKMDSKFEAINSRISNLYWGFAILIVIMLFIPGFIIWDRHTDPVRKIIASQEKRLEKLEKITREYAKKDPDFAELLKVAGLL